MKKYHLNRRAAYLLMMSMGLWGLMAGMALWFVQAASPVYAQDPQTAEPLEYVGARECRSCHRGDLNRVHEASAHALTLRYTGDGDTEAILADFSGDAAPQILFPGATEPRRLAPADIAYAIGTGTYAQNYLYDLGDDGLAVLPVQWNAVSQSWQPYLPDRPWPGPDFDWQTNCAGCHVTGLNIETGAWRENGVQCEACHGPGSAHLDAADAAGRRPTDEQVLAIRASIYNTPDSQMCGQCHAQGTAGDRPYPVEYVPGQTDLLDNFALVSPEDAAHWWPTGHARGQNMQFNEWLDSGHASALAALQTAGVSADDTCLSCHSADYAFAQRKIMLYEDGELDDPMPEAAALETAQSGVTCLSCHVTHTATEQPFQLRDTPYNLCVQCHSSSALDFVHHPTREMFEGLEIVPNVLGVASSHFSEENVPDCVGCHMERIPTLDGHSRASHSFSTILPGAVINIEGLHDSCMSCHKNQVTPELMQQLIDDVQRDTRDRLDIASAALNSDTPDWVRDALAFVQGDGSLGIHNYAYTDRLLDAVEAELGLSPTGSGS